MAEQFRPGSTSEFLRVAQRIFLKLNGEQRCATCAETNGLTVPDVGSMHSSAVSHPDDTGTICAISDPGHAVGAISCPIPIRAVTYVAPVNSVRCVAIAVGNRRIAVAVCGGISVVVIIAVSAIAVWIAVAISVTTSVVRGGKCSPNQGTSGEPEPGTAPTPTAVAPATVAPAAMEAKGPSLSSR